MKVQLISLSVAFCCTGIAPALHAEEMSSAEQAAKMELAKKSLNPIASMISVPIKLDRDFGVGPQQAARSSYVLQPVVPISLNSDWNVISRTILPYVQADSPVADGNSVNGLGDTLQSFYFSPVKPTAAGWIWGVGPMLSLPTATKDQFGSEKWSAGPTAVVLRQENGFTYGGMAYHLWSFASAGDNSRASVNQSYFQPIFAYTTKTFTSFGFNTEATFDWTQNQWNTPINYYVAQMLKIGSQPISLQAGYRDYVSGPAGHPDHGFRLQLTLLFPR